LAGSIDDIPLWRNFSLFGEIAFHCAEKGVEIRKEGVLVNPYLDYIESFFRSACNLSLSRLRSTLSISLASFFLKQYIYSV
jgi:hypothetical protein